MTRASCAVAIVLLTASVAAAQTTPTPTLMFRHGSTINLFTGAATAPGVDAAVGGAGVGWELTPRFAIEGSGQWLEWDPNAHGFGAAMTAQVGLVRARSLMPFLMGGVGLYHVEFTHPDAIPMPGFYGRRMRGGVPTGVMARFTDPTIVFGGGLNAFVSRHWAVRPDVQEIAVLRDAHSYYLTTFTVHVAYHFEDHPITPRVR